MKQLTHPRRKRSLSWQNWIVSLIILAVSVSLVYPRLFKQTNTKTTVVKLIEVTKEIVEDFINESGVVELETQQTLKAPLDGTVAKVLVKTGDRLASGQKLVLLADPQRETSTYEQNLNLQKKLIALATKEKEVADTKIDLQLQQNKLENELQLLERGFISENEFQTQQEQVRQANRKLSQAQQELATAKLDLKLQELEQTKIIAEQQKNLVTAPVSSKVLEVNIKKGDVVKLGDSLLTIGNPQKQIVKLQLSTLNATKVKLGQMARVSKIGPKSQLYSGVVQSLSLIASKDNSSGNNNSSQPTVSAIVKLDKPTQELILGSQVSVDIVLSQQKDMAVLPINTIIQNEKEPFVWVKNEQGLVNKKSVTLGLEGVNSVAIKSGLKPGDRVILPSANVVLQPGMKVSVMED